MKTSEAKDWSMMMMMMMLLLMMLFSLVLSHSAVNYRATSFDCLELNVPTPQCFNVNASRVGETIFSQMCLPSHLQVRVNYLLSCRKTFQLRSLDVEVGKRCKNKKENDCAKAICNTALSKLTRKQTLWKENVLSNKKLKNQFEKSKKVQNKTGEQLKVGSIWTLWRKAIKLWCSATSFFD